MIMDRTSTHLAVIPGLDPGIHADGTGNALKLRAFRPDHVDDRVKPGHDERARHG